MPNRLERAIAAYQIVCGLWAALLLVIAIPQFGAIGTNALVILVPSAAAAASILVGALLWQGRPTAFRYSIALQLLQVLGLCIPGLVAFGLRLGFSFDVTWRAEGATEWPAVYFTFGLGQHDEPFRVSINFLALLVILLLNAARPEPVDRRQPHDRTSEVASA